MSTDDFKLLFGRKPYNSRNPMIFLEEEDFSQMVALVNYYRRISGTKKFKVAAEKTRTKLEDLAVETSGSAFQAALNLAEAADKKKHAALIKRVEYGIWNDPCATVRKGEIYADFHSLAKAFCASAREQMWQQWTSPGVHGYVVYQNMMLGVIGGGSTAAVRFGPDCEAKNLETLLAADWIGDVPSRFKQQAGHLQKTPEEIELCKSLQ